jgi:hypothetical protein
MITEDGTRLYGPRRLLPETMHEYVDVQGDCWIWQLHCDKYGYGRSRKQGRTLLAHRMVYEMLVAAIPDGLTLDHLCRVHPCVNPDHLEPVSATENIRRSPLLRPTHCVNGHLLAGGNVYVPSCRPTRRQCRTCHRDRSRAWARRKRSTT